ncbi:MAG: peptidylprolyl isomerase [Elainella sp. Prado103]|nr:peptidylprolyl isomerase [Elainella sp. Prado103]
MTSLGNPLPEVLYRLILDQAIATVEYSATEWQKFRQYLQAETCQPGLRQEGLRQEGVTAEQFEDWMDRALKIRKFQHQRWGKTVNSYFLQRKSQLDQVIFSRIYLSDPEIAQELYFRIIEGEATFTEVALAFSQGEAVGEGSQVGPIPLGQLEAPLVQWFHGGRPGQIWAPMRMGRWMVITRLEEILPVRFDESMRQTLLNELLENWLADQVKQRFPSAREIED